MGDIVIGGTVNGDIPLELTSKIKLQIMFPENIVCNQDVVITKEAIKHANVIMEYTPKSFTVDEDGVVYVNELEIVGVSLENESGLQNDVDAELERLFALNDERVAEMIEFYEEYGK